ncbi:MAG: PhoH family protein [Saccharofermentanales bacterium]|nr:PhoH family protein [Eubacteriales bacterium]MDD3610982.1 PhoH family protein [Eubacteriales bacterium]MDD3931500.1 PhoH family protein [Eubacteriales bacterium]
MEKNNRIFEKHIELDSPEEALSLLGACSCHGDLVERALSVDCETTAEGVVIRGPVRKKVEAAAQIFDRLHELCRDGTPVTEQLVRYLLDAALEDTFSEAELFTPDLICVNAKGKPVLSKTAGQKKYIEAIRKHDLTFAIGPAGTGKTYLSVAMAVKAFRDHDVSRIILTRPAVEAGENLGFLPGDLQNKVDPYMRPLYDSLNDLMGYDAYHRHLERGEIEVSPLAYMRGRTLDDAFIILDEAQNSTREQMKMFLTRIGYNAKAVVTGDITQIDLPRSTRSGLADAAALLKNVEGIANIELTERDVVRNPLVQRIIRAYEKADEKRMKNRREGYKR